MKSRSLCVRDGCHEPRWRGPNGNKKLTLCERHQREDWRRRKNPNAKTRRPRDGSQQPAPAPVVETPGPELVPAPTSGKAVKVILVDHNRDVVQRFDVPVMSEKKLSDVRNAKRLIDFYEATGHVVIEIGVPEPNPIIELVKEG